MIHHRLVDQLRFGRQFRALRIRLERRQSDVAAGSGLSRSLIASIDRGQLAGVTMGSLSRAAAALGADVDLRLRWRGEQLDRLVDQAHAAVVDAILRRLGKLGWVVEVEVSFSIWGERGSVDIVGFHPAFGALLVIEAKSVVADSQATLHGLDRKARLAREIVKDRGWNVRHVSRLLVIAATPTARRRIDRLGPTFAAALPARGAAVRAWLRRPDRSTAGLLFVAIDSQEGARRRNPARERVRRPKRALMTDPVAADRSSVDEAESAADTASLSVN